MHRQHNMHKVHRVTYTVAMHTHDKHTSSYNMYDDVLVCKVCILNL